MMKDGEISLFFATSVLRQQNFPFKEGRDRNQRPVADPAKLWTSANYTWQNDQWRTIKESVIYAISS